MGLVFVFFFWLILGVVLSVVGAVVLVPIVGFLTRGVPSGRKRAMVIAAGFPAACFAYLFAAVILFGIYSTFRGDDLGFGDSWDSRLTGDYRMLMIDLTDQSVVYNAKDTNSYNSPSALYCVLRLDVRPPYIAGARDITEGCNIHHDSARETEFFLLDTRSRQLTREPTLTALQADAQPAIGALQLKPVSEVYKNNRYDVLDASVGVALLVPLIGITVYLLWRLIRLRATRNDGDANAPTTIWREGGWRVDQQ